MELLNIKFKRLVPEAIMPVYKNLGDAGCDLAIYKNEVILPNCVTVVKLGFSVEIPDGYEMQIRPRSGFAIKYPLLIANAPGTVDSGYRGEVAVIIRNLANEAFNFVPGTRIAQAVFSPVFWGCFNVVQELGDSSRGTGGLGSTGM